MITQKIYEFDEDIIKEGEVIAKEGYTLHYKYNSSKYFRGFLIRKPNGDIYLELNRDLAKKIFKGYSKINSIVMEWSDYKLWAGNDKYLVGRHDNHLEDIICNRETLEVINCKYNNNQAHFKSRWLISKIIHNRGLNCWVRRSEGKYWLCRGTYRLRSYVYELDNLIHTLKHITQEQIDNMETYF